MATATSITVRQRWAVSCDIFFYKLGGGWLDFQGIGADRLGEYARQFGLDEPTRVELPARLRAGADHQVEASALQTDLDHGRHLQYEHWPGDVLVTPLQMAMSRGDRQPRPAFPAQFVDHITDAEGRVVQPVQAQADPPGGGTRQPRHGAARVVRWCRQLARRHGPRSQGAGARGGRQDRHG